MAPPCCDTCLVLICSRVFVEGGDAEVSPPVTLLCVTGVDTRLCPRRCKVVWLGASVTPPLLGDFGGSGGGFEHFSGFVRRDVGGTEIDVGVGGDVGGSAGQGEKFVGDYGEGEREVLRWDVL